MPIYDELVRGTARFTVLEDGSETVRFDPPTHKDLRAAREIKRLVDLNKALAQVLTTNQNQFNLLAEEFERMKNAYESLHASGGQASAVGCGDVGHSISDQPSAPNTAENTQASNHGSSNETATTGAST